MRLWLAFLALAAVVGARSDVATPLAAVKRRHVAEAEASLHREHIGRIHRVISMSLYGDDSDYAFGAIENAMIVRRDWPSWKLWVFHDEGIDQSTLTVLRDLGVVLHPRTAPGIKDHNPMFWRFEVAKQTNVTRFLIRDCDARLTPRDKAAVDEWIASNQFFHVMRDHPFHGMPVMGGMWGAVGGFLPHAFFDAPRTTIIVYNDDQQKLKKYVWPFARRHALVHDSFFCEKDDFKGTKWRPFPQQRVSKFDFVGNKYLNENRYLGLNLTQECPVTCRKHVEWASC